MAGVRERRRFIEDIVATRRKQVDPVAALKRNHPVDRRTQPNRRGRTVTMSFTAPAEIDQVIDKWSARWDLPRSVIIRQAILRADLFWQKANK